jgi:alpha-tubulin suppressor-like RCC1 family protein
MGEDAGQPRGPTVQAKSIAAGFHHACAILQDDRVACWGRTDWGHLGDGTSSPATNAVDSHGAVIVPGLSGVTRLVAGTGLVCLADGSCVFGDTTCALLGDATAKCWGLGAYGQLGNGKEGRDYFEASPVALQLNGIVDLALGGGTGCAALQDGTVSCWGANSGKALGFTSPDCGPFYGFRTDTTPPPMKSPCQATPRAVDGLQNAAHVAVGGAHQCVVHRDQTVTCWGGNIFGELGNGQPTNVDSMAVPPGAPIAGFKAAQVALGAHHSCAVLPDGSVDCWGYNSSGQLGLGNDNSEYAKPTAVPGLAKVKSLSLASDTSVALLDDGTGFGWGIVQYVFKETPDPTSAAIYRPTKMGWVTDATGLETSYLLTCTLHGDRTVSCHYATGDEYQVRFRDP